MITAMVATLSTTRQMIVDTTNVSVNNPCYVRLQEASAAIVIGGSNVTTSIGQTVAATSGVRDLVLGPGDDLYAIAASGTPTVRMFITGAGIGIA